MDNRPINEEEDEEDDVKTLTSNGPPSDRFNMACFLIGLLSMGSLYPWNFFITAADYFHYSFRNTTEPASRTVYQSVFENTLAVVACACGVVGLVINTALTRYVSLKKRIYIGFVTIAMVFTGTMVLAAVDTDTWQKGFFILTIFSILVINLAGSLVIGGLAGVQGQLPVRFATSMMVGQTVAGLFATFAAIFSVLSEGDGQDSGSAIKHQGTAYFASAVVATVVCTLAFGVFLRRPFVKYYLQSPRPVTIQDSATDLNDIPSLADAGLLVERTKVTTLLKRVWPQAATLIITFATTLSAFPALASSVRSVNAADGSLINNQLFLPVACFLVVNASDFAGRLSHGLLQFPRPQQGLLALALSILRIGIVPLLMLCNAQPRDHLTVEFGDAVFVACVSVLMFSNGYLGNLGIMYGPKLVPPQDAETTGSLMSLCLNVGLFLGSALSFAVTYVI